MVSRVAIYVIMRDEDGRILLQQRHNTGYLDGFYDFACSGHVDPGESIHDAAIRELAEEIGIFAQSQDLKLVHINQNYMDFPYINFTFELSKWQGTPRIAEPEKCSDLAYFDQNDLPERCTLNVRLNEQNGFAHDLRYSKVTLDDFTEIMGGTFEELTGKKLS